MGIDLQTEIRGLKEAQEKMEQVLRDLTGDVMVDAFRRAALVVQRDAKINAPVDTGRLRSSITPVVEVHGREIRGIVGSNLKYAPYMEFGTRPHFPPLDALRVWAARHGTSAYAVALAIAARGIKGREYLQRALKDNQDKVVDIIQRAIERSVDK